MSSDIYWIDGLTNARLALMPRPRGGEWLAIDVAAWASAGLGCIVSLLEQQEVVELELGDEPALCAARQIEYLSFPIPDRGVPAAADSAAELVAQVCGRLSANIAVGVHCRAGIGRSALICGGVLCALGVPFADVFPRLSRARRISVPDTDAQAAWLEHFDLASSR